MLDISLPALIAQIIGFALLVAFMAKFAYGPISGIIDQRQKEIQDTLEQIAADRRSMEQSRADYERRLAGIEEEARTHIQDAVKRAQEEGAKIIAAAQAQAATERDKAVTDIDQERRKAVAQIRSEMADLAVVAASKILDREINPEVHRGLIGDFIQQVGARS